ncbi:GNAT family N-acetyltransferase [Flavobacterium sp. LC2016-12]|uniref:GNAT family N-acetyltransferase n=1 Tax=Flavobacterium sp. LC2016-12 TaxID=2783794 RepID=UPI00188D8179|nr:GNAT family N-acetyltransferase [Flavobacterium sp. LC2016-12]MBF4465686.1 GNAT family N-acetyltransferase [Flavobacterium sp. LC2016-12]
MVKSFEIKEISVDDTQVLRNFIDNAGNSIESFRYFNTRPLEIISNHVITVVVLDDKIPVGYGHLDKEDDKIWFGIAISEQYKGKGLGKKIMQYLTDYADRKKMSDLFLSVDKSNTIAIKMYENFNFLKVKDLSENVLLMKRKCDYEI